MPINKTQQPKESIHASILLAPTLELAKTIDATATVEAEYGDICVEGTEITMAHHGSRSGNPAPCNWPDEDVPTLPNATVLVSHIDLDTIGGIQKIMGIQIEDKEFWKAAEFIDVNGPHHLYELAEKEQDKLNAVWAWAESSIPRVRYQEVTDVSEPYMLYTKALQVILDERHPDHQQYIENGRQWAKKARTTVESKLREENDNIRVFITDGVFCSASYFSPEKEKIIPATITLNEKFNSITVAFADGGKSLSAREFVQSIWGQEAGGHDGIAGSPRGQTMTLADLSMASAKLNDVMEKAMEFHTISNSLTELTSEGHNIKEVAKEIVQLNNRQKELGNELAEVFPENKEFAPFKNATPGNDEPVGKF